MQHSDASRNSPNYQYRWSGSTVDWCDATNCYEGGVGDLEQTQTDYTWNFKASSPLFSGDVNYGAELKTIEAQKNRSADYNSFGLQKSPVNGVDWNCPAGDPSCKADNAARQYINYAAHDARGGSIVRRCGVSTLRRLVPGISGLAFATPTMIFLIIIISPQDSRLRGSLWTTHS